MTEKLELSGNMVWEKYAALIHKICWRYPLHAQIEHDELVHEAFLYICKKLHLYNPEKAGVGAFVGMMAHYACQSFRSEMAVAGTFAINTDFSEEEHHDLPAPEEAPDVSRFYNELTEDGRLILRSILDAPRELLDVMFICPVYDVRKMVRRYIKHQHNMSASDLNWAWDEVQSVLAAGQ